MKKINILMCIFLMVNMLMLTKGQGPGGITPQLWYKGDAGITTSAGTVTQWNNSASSSYNLVQQGGAGTIPAYNTSQINFNPSVRFDGTNDRMYAPTVPQTVTTTAAAPYTTSQYIVYRKLGSAANPLYSHSDGVGGTWNVGGNSDGGMLITNRSISTTAPATNEVRLQEIDGNSSTASTYLNGAFMSSALSSTASTATGTPNFWVGAQGTNNFSNSDIAEIVIYNAAQSTTGRQQIESYLALKYGITKSGNYIASNGTTNYWNAATNTGYNNNITGIARDDNSSLYQKQSISINTGQQILIGLTGMANTNATNSGTLTDQQFLVVGDNGLTKVPSTAISGIAGVNYRFGSVWKVQNTGSVGTVRIMWPQGLNNLKLVQNNSDATFTTGNTVTDMSANTQTINGVVYNYADVSLANGQFFTLAAQVYAPGGVLASLWYRADRNLTPATGSVTSWKDYSYGGVNLSPVLSASTSAPAAINGIGSSLNFNPGVSFVQANAIGNSSALNAITGLNYTVYNSTTQIVNTTARIFGINISGLNGVPKYDSPGIQSLNAIIRNAAGTSVINTTLNPAYGLNPSITRTSITSATISRAQDGSAVGSTGTFSGASIPNGGIMFGRNINDGGDDNGFDGTVSETIIFDGTLSTDQINRVDSYLAIKGGITLNTTNTPNYLNSDSLPIWTGSTNTGYQNNITGIGRDDFSDLNQKQSQSINTGSQVLIGIGGALANTNALNVNSFSANQQFVIWGDNGLARTPSVAISAISGANYRFASVWKVQNTGTVGTVRIMWPQGLNNLKLVQNNSDATFTTGNTVTDMSANTQTINGVVYNYADVSLANGQFFTLAAFVQAPGGVINNLQVWNKADFGTNTTVEGGTITSWNNSAVTGGQLQSLSGFSSHTASSTYMNLGSNFNPTVRMIQGAGLGMLNAFSTTVTTSGTGGTFYNVSKAGAGGAPTLAYNVQMNVSAATLSAVGSSTGEMGPYINNATSSGMFVFPANVTTTNFFNPSVNNILGLAYTTGTAGAYPYKVNGKNNAPTGSYTPFAFTGRNFHLNTDTDGGAERGGFDYQEVIGYERQITLPEQNRIESYLAVKYGVTMDQTTATNYVATDASVIWNATTNAAYNQNITGIGRDDNTALNQKQSQSINTGSQVAIGISGALANTNALNVNSFSTDKQYLIWGDNGLAKSLLVAINGIPGINSRFAAIWKVQNTASVGTVRVTWPQGITNLKLLQSTDAVFDNTDTVTNMAANTQVINGVTYNYADVTLTDGQYFTFAGLANAPGGVLAPDFWVKSDDAGTIATAWKDLSVNNNPIENVGAMALSVANKAHNFHPFTTGYSTTKYFRDSNTSMTVDNTFGVQTRTSSSIFSAVRATSLGSGRITGIDNDDLYAAEPGMSINLGNPYQYEFYETTTSNSMTIPFTANRSGIFSTIQDQALNAGNGQRRLGLDGTYEVYNAPAGNFYHVLGKYLFVGYGIWDLNGPFTGDIMEVIWYKRALSQNEQSRVNSYLAIRNGTTLAENYLASDNTVVWSRTVNASFNNNIFGVGRDDSGLLDQRVSNSVNINSILTASTIQDFASDNSNVSRTALADKSYMIFGDNNIHTGTTVVNPVSCPALADGLVRINKTWLVQETGTVGASYFEVDLSSYNINSEISLYFADDSGFTTNTGISPAVSISGGKAIFYYNFKNGQYFTVVGKVGPAACQTCLGGKQTLQNGLAWFNGGITGATNNALNNVPLNGTAPASGALSADISVTYPSGVEWIPTIFPRMYGKWTQLSRYDNVSGAAGKVSYTVNLKDISGTKAAKTSFQIAGITKLAGQATIVKVIGYCGANQVIPKMNYAYNSTPALNNILRRYTIDPSTGTASGTQPYLDITDFATVNVDFEKPVERIVIEWTIERSPVFSKVDYLYIGDMSFVCDNPIEPTPDNVSIIASYIENQLPTCEDATLKLNIKNNNCISKTIDINNVLPAGLQYVADSYVGLGTEAPTYAGQNFLLNDLTVPSGNSYIYVKVRPSGAGTYATHFNFTVDGGINNPNPYRSDDDSGIAGYQDTSITYTASTAIVKPTITKSVNRCFGTSSTELEYTVNITNNDTNPITNVEFTDNLDAAQTYIAGSLVQTNFTANGTAIFDGDQVYISGMSIAAGQTAVVKFKVNTNTSATMAYTDVDGSKYFNNLASVTVNPQSLCGAANSVSSNLLKVLACTFCTKDPNLSPADTITKIGITIQTKQNGWPENLPNGAVALESKTRGFVITRSQSSAIVNPVEGMLMYDTVDKCMKLYNGTSWHCVVRSCNE